MLNIAVIGAGRIGSIHAGNIAAHPEARLAGIADTDAEAAARLAARCGAKPITLDEAFGADAVFIASPTPTHADYIERAAHAGRAVFCEKPIDLSAGRVQACLEVVRAAGIPLMVGFNRRFDPHFAALKRRIDAGSIGALEMLLIISRDPSPPPLSYVETSGGLFRDMMIHDLDMACWLLGEAPVEVFASASVLVDPAIGAAGDVDTAVVTLRMASGALCQIANSRRAVYGYDQRIELLGSTGALQAENVVESTVVFSGIEGVVSDKPLPFFLERYAEAYRRELDHFVASVAGGAGPLVGGRDGVRALALADAASESARSGRPVAL